MARVREEVVRIPVQGITHTLCNSNANLLVGSNYRVMDKKGNVIPSQTVPSFAPFPKNKPSPYVLYFKVTVLGLGINDKIREDDSLSI